VLQVNRAVDYVGGGTKALVEAKTLQKSKRKWCCCAIILLLIIIVIVVVVVSGSSAGALAGAGMAMC
jgi:syntaxin 1B/2/3